MDLPPGGSGQTVDMTQKNSQAFDSGLGSGTALVQGANNRSLREVEEDLASKLAAIKLDEPNDQQNNELHLENHRLKDKLSSTEKKHEKELNRIKRQIGTQIEDVHKKLANEKAQNKLLEEQLANEKAKNKLLEEQNDQQNNEFHLENHRLKDKLSSTEKKHEKELNWIKRQIGTQIEDVHKKLANEKAKNKLLEEQLANEKAKNKLLEEQLANEKAKNKLLEEQLANGEEKNKLLEEQTAEQRKTCNILVRSTQPEPGYIAIMLDHYARSTDPMVYRYAYFRLLNAFKEHAPERPFPSQDDLTCLQVGWKGSYVNTELPCAIQTLRDWYRVSIGDIPYAFYGFIPGIHRNVSHEFIRKYFYVLHSLKFEERGQLKGALHEETYVLCYTIDNGDGHMGVETRRDLEIMIDDQASSNITHFYICLPRGTSSVDPCDAWYTYKTFQSLEELTQLQLTENEYLVKVTTSKGDDECFPWKRGNEGYYTEWSPNNQVNYTTGKLYVKKGLFPFIKQPRML